MVEPPEQGLSQLENYAGHSLPGPPGPRSTPLPALSAWGALTSMAHIQGLPCPLVASQAARRVGGERGWGSRGPSRPRQALAWGKRLLLLQWSPRATTAWPRWSEHPTMAVPGPHHPLGFPKPCAPSANSPLLTSSMQCRGAPTDLGTTDLGPEGGGRKRWM